jgi:Asp-tRNA(Asn)/Glu-tRNA(Gln) amidotransferase A subunit family amidase
VDPADLDAVELLAAFRAHELSLVEATAAVLARIAKLDP